MSSEKKSRVLGFAFLFQALTSLISGAVLFTPLIVEGNIHQSMVNIANNPLLLKFNILGQMITAMGIVFLAAVLLVLLRKQGEKIAYTAFGLYLLEAALLAFSEIADFSLLCISQEYVISGQSDFLIYLGNLAYKAMKYGQELHMLVFCIGAILFYYLLYKSKIIHRILSLWGLIAVIPCLIATLAELFGYSLPFFIYVPYVPFEFFVGIYILIKGLPEESIKNTGSVL